MKRILKKRKSKDYHINIADFAPFVRGNPQL